MQMAELLYEVPPGLDPERIRSQDEVGYPRRVLDITERFRRTHEPVRSRLFFVPFARPYNQVHFFAGGAMRGPILCEAPDLRTESTPVDALLEQKQVLIRLGTAPIRTVSACPGGWHKNNEGLLELCISTMVILAYLCHHFLRASVRVGAFATFYEPMLPRR